jgi:hypothetical protein
MSRDDTVHISLSMNGRSIEAYDGDISLSVLLKDYIDKPLRALLDEFYGIGDRLAVELMDERAIEKDVADLNDDETMDGWEDMFEEDAVERRDPRLRGSIIEGEFVERK